MLNDLPFHELHSVRPLSAEPGDFDDFWSSTLAESRAASRPPTVTPVEVGLRTVDI